jgi:hypothetical protein
MKTPLPFATPADLQPRAHDHAFFSLSPTGGEGWGEGAKRSASQRMSTFKTRPGSLGKPGRASCSSARPLTLTLSPDGGEGIRLWIPGAVEARRVQSETPHVVSYEELNPRRP